MSNEELDTLIAELERRDARVRNVPWFLGWWRELPCHTPDAYWWDHPRGEPWTPEGYENEVRRYFDTFGKDIPARRIVPFRTVTTSGEQRPNTEAEERFITDTWGRRRVRRFFVWVGCDSFKEARESIALLTPDRLRWMREGGAA